jgi:hypothetical protein
MPNPIWPRHGNPIMYKHARSMEAFVLHIKRVSDKKYAFFH